jgi:hypothetical protein
VNQKPFQFFEGMVSEDQVRVAAEIPQARMALMGADDDRFA